MRAPTYTEDDLRSLSPNIEEMKWCHEGGFIVTARSENPEYDFVSRYFAPSLGVNEDPVTGSTHCALGPYWKKILNKNEFVAYQASERGGSMKVRVSGRRVLP